MKRERGIAYIVVILSSIGKILFPLRLTERPLRKVSLSNAATGMD